MVSVAQWNRAFTVALCGFLSTAQALNHDPNAAPHQHVRRREKYTQDDETLRCRIIVVDTIYKVPPVDSSNKNQGPVTDETISCVPSVDGEDGDDVYELLNLPESILSNHSSALADGSLYLDIDGYKLKDDRLVIKKHGAITVIDHAAVTRGRRLQWKHPRDASAPRRLDLGYLQTKLNPRLPNQPDHPR